MNDTDTRERALRLILDKIEDAQAAMAEDRKYALQTLAAVITEGWEPGDSILVIRKSTGALVQNEEQPFKRVTGDTEVFVTLGAQYTMRTYAVGTYTFENVSLRERAETATVDS